VRPVSCKKTLPAPKETQGACQRRIDQPQRAHAPRIQHRLNRSLQRLPRLLHPALPQPLLTLSLLLFLPPPVGRGCVSCAPLATSAEGSAGCAASFTVLRWPALADGSVLGRLASPRDVLVSTLLLPAAAALPDGPPPAPPLALAFCSLTCCAHPPSTSRTERRGATTETPQAPRYSPPTRALETSRRSPHAREPVQHLAPSSAPPRAPPPRSAPPPCGPPTLWSPGCPA
jgi:hypothetical protein